MISSSVWCCFNWTTSPGFYDDFWLWYLYCDLYILILNCSFMCDFVLCASVCLDHYPLAKYIFKHKLSVVFLDKWRLIKNKWRDQQMAQRVKSSFLPVFFSERPAFFPFVNNNLGHPIRTLLVAGFLVGLIKNNVKHQRTLLDCLFSRTSLLALHLHFGGEVMSYANYLLSTSFVAKSGQMWHLWCYVKVKSV